jgi:hypothetical protein
MAMPIDCQIDFFRREMSRQRKFWDSLVQRGQMQPAARDRNLDLVRSTLATLEAARDAAGSPVRLHPKPAGTGRPDVSE